MKNKQRIFLSYSSLLTLINYCYKTSRCQSYTDKEFDSSLYFLGCNKALLDDKAENIKHISGNEKQKDLAYNKLHSILTKALKENRCQFRVGASRTLKELNQFLLNHNLNPCTLPARIQGEFDIREVSNFLTLPTIREMMLVCNPEIEIISPC